MDVCAMCCLQENYNHTFKQVEEATDHAFRPIEDMVGQMTSRIGCLRGAAAQSRQKETKMLDNVHAIELEVKKRSLYIHFRSFHSFNLNSGS